MFEGPDNSAWLMITQKMLASIIISSSSSSNSNIILIKQDRGHW